MTGVFIRREDTQQIIHVTHVGKKVQQRLEWYSHKPKMPRRAGVRQKLLSAKEGFSPKAFRGSVALLTPQCYF